MLKLLMLVAALTLPLDQRPAYETQRGIDPSWPPIAKALAQPDCGPGVITDERMGLCVYRQDT